MKIKLLIILTCCLMLLCSCGQEEFTIEGKWKNVGDYTFGQVQKGAIIAFDGNKCNFYSPSDTYAFYKDGDSYTLECTSLGFSETLTFDVEVIDNDHINLYRGNNVLELQRPGSGSLTTEKKKLTKEQKKAKKQALQFVMYEDISESEDIVLYDINDVLLDGMDVKKAEIGAIEHSQGKEDVVNITFTSKGADKFAEVTNDHVGERIAVISNGELLFAPVIQSQITDGKCVISSFEDATKMQEIVDALN